MIFGVCSVSWAFPQRLPGCSSGFCKDGFQKKEKKREELEGKREKLQLQLVRSVNASITLCEATAKAVQRIPDAHCNGDMHAALDYAAKVKHEQKDFLTKQGIQAILE